MNTTFSGNLHNLVQAALDARVPLPVVIAELEEAKLDVMRIYKKAKEQQIAIVPANQIPPIK
jgi:hypothetical protein